MNRKMTLGRKPLEDEDESETRNEELEQMRKEVRILRPARKKI